MSIINIPLESPIFSGHVDDSCWHEAYRCEVNIMPDPSHGAVRPTADTDERTPLLSNSKQSVGNETPERRVDEDEEQDNDENEVPIAEEASIAKLLLVLGSIWIGCFLAALGLADPS